MVFNESGTDVPFDDHNLKKVIAHIEDWEPCHFQYIEVVFVNSEKILEINKKYLGHNQITDIITFPYEEDFSLPEGTLYCCAEQIKEQSREYDTSFGNEILRVVIHGLLHLAGYDDNTDAEREKMRNLETTYMTLYLGD